MHEGNEGLLRHPDRDTVVAILVGGDKGRTQFSLQSWETPHPATSTLPRRMSELSRNPSF